MINSDITPLEAIKLLERAVEEKGRDYVLVDSCQYFSTDGSPQCIVGYALSYIGWTKEDVDRLEANEATIYDSTYFDCFFRNDVDVLKVFGAAQAIQDSIFPDSSNYISRRGTWGQALEAAKLEYRRLFGVLPERN